MQDLLKELMLYRRYVAEAMTGDRELIPQQVAALASLQGAISAVEAVIAEPEPPEKGPRVIYGEDGWPQKVGDND
ncbi:hypothetical protein [Rhizobium gallicum]|uniref:hypothetical protein n=1 Tax=Rhizobium gallicum TaxID=56730 RepID=UPI001EF8D436|nr:hypothetical protein [Rhizobium gallicum]ULJ72589.1 hypothetical protein L2W42_02490 [Rhizobium gallicum]